MVIIEGKKEDVANKLKQKFQYDNPFIDQVLNIDPTGYKYVDYIARQLEKIITELQGPKGGLNYQQGQSIYDVFYKVIPWFHTNFDRITEDDIWKAEAKFREKHGNFDDIINVVKNPKDINQYTNPAFLESLMDIVDSRKSNKEVERELKNQAEKLFEDSDVLVIKPKTYQASCYYGANTKWCTTSKESSQHFKQYSEKGELYYFLNKKSGEKIALFKDKRNNSIDVYNAMDTEINLSDLRESFPNQNDLIDEITGIGQLLKTLRKFIKGEALPQDLESSDNAILDVKEKKPLGQSIIVIDFGDDDQFFKAIEIDEDDAWFLKAVESSYSGYEFMDSYQVESDFREGYTVYGELDEENNEKLKMIASIIMPEKEFLIDNEEYRIDLSKRLYDLFEKEMDSIISDYHSEKESEMNTTANQTISKNMNDYLESIGFKMYRAYNEISTTAANLMMWAARLGTTKTDVISLFKKIVEEVGNGNLGGWAENSYEFQDSDNFDSESFNREVSRQFDNIIEKLENDESVNSIQEFLEFRNKIVSKFKMSKWYELPKDKKIKFRIEGFDKNNMKVIVRISDPKNGYRNVTLSEENFNHLLYQPELFKFDELE